MAANASFVGANTVKGPGPDSVSTRSAVVSAETSVDRSGLATAISTILGMDTFTFSSTMSMICTTPFIEFRFAVVTAPTRPLTSRTNIPDPLLITVSSVPAVFAEGSTVSPSGISVDKKRSANTWYNSNSVSITPLSATNEVTASLLGANSV